MGSNRECVTILLGSNAAGKLLPPMLILDYVRVPVWTRTMPPNWVFGTSKSGWMNGELFFDYISQHFLPWLYKNNVPFPVVLFVDGHRSHMTLMLSEFCSRNRIILIALHPNSTHLLQPMDVSFFGPLKKNWKKVRTDWNMENRAQNFKKENIPETVQKAIELTLKNPNTIPNGFRATGRPIICKIE